MKKVMEIAQPPASPTPLRLPQNSESTNLGGESAAYRFCGNGLGIAGLPHAVTREQAEQDNVLDLLDAAIAAGVYQTVAAEADKE